MAYLNPVRLHFAGQFRADVSTINNDETSFNPSPSPADEQTYGDPRAGWQPSGTGAWRLSECTITAAACNGKLALDKASDPVVGSPLKNSGDRVDAKLVDLDPYQQGVSMIFGLEVRIVNSVTGLVVMRGQFTPAAFMDLWHNSPTPGFGGMTAFYQSTLTDIDWGDVAFSPTLAALKSAAATGQLSVRFMLDAYAGSGTQRGYGRIVGTIGPVLAGEPAHFVMGRHLESINTHRGMVTCCLAPDKSKILIDLGNSLPLSGHDTFTPIGDLHLVALRKGAQHTSSADVIDLGPIPALMDAAHYQQSAGIQEIPAGAFLTAEQLTAFETLQLAVATSDGAGNWTIAWAEAADGIFARADSFVCRMNPGEQQALPILVTKFGKPLASQTIVATKSSKNIGPAHKGSPPAARPAQAFDLALAGPTGNDGWTTLTITAHDPKRPRGHLDGQVYAIDLAVTGAARAGTAFGLGAMFVSVLLFSDTKVPAAPTWHDDVLPILSQYASLYPRPHGQQVAYDPKYPGEAQNPPLLHPVLSLTDQAWVASYAQRILTALALPIEHPNHMPVTRDLSAGRRGILQKWMELVLAGQIKVTPQSSAGAADILEPPHETSLETPTSQVLKMVRLKSGLSLDQDVK